MLRVLESLAVVESEGASFDASLLAGGSYIG
jgi:hypothetical protein